MKSIEKITKLMEQSRKERDLIEKHKLKSKALDDQIRHYYGEEFNERVSRLGLTAEEVHLLLRFLAPDNKAQLLEAIGANGVPAPDTEPEPVNADNEDPDEAGPDEADVLRDPDPAGAAEDDEEPETPVFDEEGDEQAS